MTTHVVNTSEAKSRLSELIRGAEQGDEVIIARNGSPVARLVAWHHERPVRVPGAWAGRITYGDDEMKSDNDWVRLFEESAQSDGPAEQ